MGGGKPTSVVFHRRFAQQQHCRCVSRLCSLPQVKFNKALADHSMAQTPRLIDGIVLTKFDTIDDKVRRLRDGSTRSFPPERW